VKRSTIPVAALVAVLGLGLTACGDDDSSGDDASTEAAGVTTTTAPEGLPVEVCDSVQALGEVFAQTEGPPTPEFMEDTFLPAVNDVVEAAADEDAVLEPALEVQALVEESGAEVDVDAVLAAYNDVVGPTHTECGYEEVDVNAIDYGYENVPETVPAGVVSIAMTNEGNEQHEMILFRRGDGETRPVEDLLALPEDEFGQVMTFTSANVVEPGATGVANAELTPGGYVGICFLPVGGGEEGPPHFLEGMVTEFEVS
jgi:hypothetical protein